MIAVILTDSGNYNVIGIEGDSFILQGNLTKDQLEELQEKISQASFVCDHKWRDYSEFGGDFVETPIVCRDCGEAKPL